MNPAAGPVPDPNTPGASVGKPIGLLERLVSSGNARVIGFLPLELRRSPFELARCWQLYRMNELTVRRSGAVERFVRVCRLKSHTGKTVKNTVAYVKNKIRTNPERNRRLATLARALRAGDERKLRRLMPSSSLTECSNAPRHILVLVENLKQANALKKHLPDWPLVSGLGGDTTVTKDETINVTRGVIGTALGVEMLTGDEYDVIVRADPGDGPPPLPPDWFTTTCVSETPVLLVDVEDTGHQLAALWARRRQRAYRTVGWGFLDEDSDVTAYLRFRELIHKRKGQS